MDVRPEDLMPPILRPSPYRPVTGVVEAEPEPKPRARFVPGKPGRMISSKKQKEAEAFVGFHLRQKIRNPLTGKLALCVIFYRTRHQLADADNLEKLFLDAGNKIGWEDDRQFVFKSTIVFNGCKKGSTRYSICSVPDFPASTGYYA